jgi:hypothetical protein
MADQVELLKAKATESTPIYILSALKLILSKVTDVQRSIVWTHRIGSLLDVLSFWKVIAS